MCGLLFLLISDCHEGDFGKMKKILLIVLPFLLFVGCEKSIDEETLNKFESTKLSDNEIMASCNGTYHKDEFSDIIIKSINNNDYGEMNDELMEAYKKLDLYQSNYKLMLFASSLSNQTNKLLNISLSEISADKQYILKGSSNCKIKFMDGDILELKHNGESDFGTMFVFNIKKKSDYYKLRTKEIDVIRLVGESNVHDYRIHSWNKDYLIKNLQCIDNPF